MSHNPPLGDSDHDVLNFELKCYTENIASKEIPNYYKVDYTEITRRLREINSGNHLTGSFQQSYKNFIDILDVSIEGCVPKKRYNHNNKKGRLYMTKEGLRVQRLKKKLWKRYLISKSNYDLIHYKRVKKRLRALTHNLRYNFEASIARDSYSSPKKFWSYVNSRLKTRSRIPILKHKDGLTAVSPAEKATMLNDFFGSVFTNENLSDIPRLDREVDTQLDHFAITEENVMNEISKLDPD